MTVFDLIEILRELPPDSSVEVWDGEHQVYTDPKVETEVSAGEVWVYIDPEWRGTK